ncbi:hypothetical protein TNCV_2279221 [Trichonephila clavipes]|uniref:Uncharacterized protein n=1 Tax=Trichonephila clavipes TaxID=2585209 RepID=A0A8X6V0B4_TRICX|nr:hypothetical protein TNCV_2279221 [Trichonephila clavipes]
MRSPSSVLTPPLNRTIYQQIITQCYVVDEVLTRLEAEWNKLPISVIKAQFDSMTNCVRAYFAARRGGELFLLISPSLGDRLTNTFTKDFCVGITNTFKKDFLCLDNEHIFGGDQGDTPEIMDEILTTARDLELEVNEDDI